MNLSPPSGTKDNRRHFARIHFNTSGRLIFEAHQQEVEVLDISLKGALVRLESPDGSFETGENCMLEAPLGEDPNQAVIRMAAKVAYRRDQEVGLSCLEIDLDSMTHLRRLVELNLGDESALNRELEQLLFS